METTRSQGQVAAGVVLVALLLALILRRRHRHEAPAAATATGAAKGAVLEAARQARSTSASTIGKAGEAAHGLIGGASELLGHADVGETIEKLQQGLDDVRSALATRGR